MSLVGILPGGRATHPELRRTRHPCLPSHPDIPLSHPDIPLPIPMPRGDLQHPSVTHLVPCNQPLAYTSFLRRQSLPLRRQGNPSLLNDRLHPGNPHLTPSPNPPYSLPPSHLPVSPLGKDISKMHCIFDMSIKQGGWAGLYYFRGVGKGRVSFLLFFPPPPP